MENLKAKAVAGGKPVIFNIPKNWLHQAITYMDRTELCVRIVVETFVIACLLYPVSIFFQTNVASWRTVLVSFCIAHTINWVLNGNWWALMMFSFPGIRNSGERETCIYLSNMAERLRRSPAVVILAVYGSLARSDWHDKSDMDLRILREKGFYNGLIAAVVTMRERAIAFISGQPIDLFLADSSSYLRKMSDDEVPLLIVKKESLATDDFIGDEVNLTDSWSLK